MAQPIIRIENLYKIYKVGNEKVVALDDINLTIYTGQIVCIVGTSGSGKSTLLNQLAGLEKPTKGKVFLGKRNISAMSEDALARFRQEHIGFIFQSYNLMQYMTALENVSLPLTFRGVPTIPRNRAAMKLLKEVGVADRAHHTPNQMSGGQQQRVGIARAFVANPRIVFADEPTGNLDSRTTIEVMRMMINLCRENNQTMIIVTHDRELAKYADRIITIMDGHVIKDIDNVSLVDIQTETEAYTALEEQLRATQQAELEEQQNNLAMRRIENEEQ